MASRLSPHSQKVFRLLNAAGKPLTAYDILDKLRRQGLRAPPTVYRALDQLMRQGLVHRLESMNAFMACRHASEHKGKPHHPNPFAICTSCGSVREIKDPVLLKAMNRLGAELFEQLDKRVFELSGICRGCKASRKKEVGHV